MNKYNFSERMKVLSSYVIKDKKAADIGTDHGFVPIHLIASDYVPFVVMTDINQGPLDKAQGNLNRVGILPQYYDLRLGSGLEPIEPSEVATIIIAGMGAETIIEILEADLDKSRSFERLVLHPRKRAFLLRKWLYEHGFTITDEKLVSENGKLCEVIAAEPFSDNTHKDINDFYLPVMLRSDPLFPVYLDDYIRKLKIVIDNVNNSNADVDSRDWIKRLNFAERIKDEESRN